MSGKMAAIVGYILGKSWTEPGISALSVTSDGFVTPSPSSSAKRPTWIGTS